MDQEDYSRSRKLQRSCQIPCDLKSAKSHSQDIQKSTVSIAVYFMSDLCLAMDIEKKATCQQVISLIQSEPQLGLLRTPLLVGNQPIFALWLCSKHLEIQLQPTQKPLELARIWQRLVDKYVSTNFKAYEEEPLLYFRRNLYLSRKEEAQIKEIKILELLYAEAKTNVLEGRYPCEGQTRYASLGALQARMELGSYNTQTHTLAFFRKHRGSFLPPHYNSHCLLLGLGFDLGLVGGKGTPEARLLEQYKRIPNHTGVNTNSRKLMRKYLEFCWGLPCYGAAFFHGQIERPVRGLASWITNCDLPVLVAINFTGLFIVDDSQCDLLLALKYTEINWEMANPCDEKNPDCLPCLFLQFPVLENGTRVFKILQIFSKQASMMDTLISTFVKENGKSDSQDDNIKGDNILQDNSILFNIGNFANKLSKFTLATFDDAGNCIGQMGSWSIQ